MADLEFDISNYEPETSKIKFVSAKKTIAFKVRGLNLRDMTFLITQHLDDIEAGKLLYDKMATDIFTRQNSDVFVRSLIRTVPGLCAEIISCAADKTSEVERFARMPLVASCEALAEVLRLTFQEAGGLRPFVESLTSLLDDLLPAETTGRIKQGLVRLLKTGSGKSENK